MDIRYKYGHRPGRRRRTRVLIVLAVSLLIVGIVGTIVVYDLRKNQDSTIEGNSRTIAQTLDETTNTVTLDDTFFTMEFPADWKEISRQNDSNERSITWQASKYREDNRYMKIYIDIIPKTYAVNRMLPLSARGNGFSVGDISNNCSTFTKSGTTPTGQTKPVKAEGAKWQGVDFICDLGQVTDNEIGTSSADGINTIVVTGPSKGKHSYFFVYTDHNIQPNYNILYNALRSFKAK